MWTWSAFEKRRTEAVELRIKALKILKCWPPGEARWSDRSVLQLFVQEAGRKTHGHTQLPDICWTTQYTCISLRKNESLTVYTEKHRQHPLVGHHALQLWLMLQDWMLLLIYYNTEYQINLSHIHVPQMMFDFPFKNTEIFPLAPQEGLYFSGRLCSLTNTFIFDYFCNIIFTLSVKEKHCSKGHQKKPEVKLSLTR